MSDKTFGTIVTQIGIEKIAEAIKNGKKINITKFAVGDGGGEYYSPTPDMTGLKNAKYSGNISSVEINEDSPNMIDITAIIGSEVGGFTIREMGVFDSEGALIAICNTPDSEKTVINSGTIAEMKLVMHIKISNTDAVNFTVDPHLIIATKKDIEDHANKRATSTEYGHVILSSSDSEYEDETMVLRYEIAKYDYEGNIDLDNFTTQGEYTLRVASQEGAINFPHSYSYNDGIPHLKVMRHQSDAFVTQILNVPESYDMWIRYSTRNIGPYGNVSWSKWKLLNSDKKSATIVVGTSENGHTSADADFLCTGENDGTVINAAIAALPDIGGKVILLEGTYNINEGIKVISKDNVVIQGMGNSTVLKKMYKLENNGNGVVFIANSKNSTIQDLCIDGNKSQYPNDSSLGICCADVENLTVSNVTCINNADCAIVISSGNKNRVINCNCSNNSYCGIIVNSDNNIVTNNICSNNLYGMIVNNNNNIIMGNMCNDNETEFRCNGSNNVVTGNSFVFTL